MNTIAETRAGDKTTTEQLSTHLSRQGALQSSRGLYMKWPGVRFHIIHLAR